jgi:hypothetical protein
MKNLICLLTLIFYPAFAQDFTFENGKAVPNFVAQVKEFRGKVYKESNGSSRPVKHGERFHKNDVVKTGEKSMVKLELIDESILNLSAQSQLKFTDYKFVDKNDREIIFNFIKGQVRSLVKNKNKSGSGVIIKTPLAVMGIRGTELLVNHRQLKNVEVSEFALLSGEAEVSNGKYLSQVIKQGDRMSVIEDKVKALSGKDLRQFSETEMTELKALATDENKEFKPFLPYLDPMNLESNSPLLPFFLEAQNQKGEALQETKASGTENNKNWKDNLNKLNEELRKNRRRQ